MKFHLLITSFFILTCFGCFETQENTSASTKNENRKVFDLGYDIKIEVPTLGEKFDSCKHYTHFEIWKGQNKVYCDTSENEYRFLCNDFYTKARKLNGNRYEILIEKFDGPDIDKSLVVYLKNDKYESEKILPFFETEAENKDGKKIYHGIFSTIDGYVNGDSCYYNPTLYYSATDDGVLLDTVLTKNKIKEVWGGFYGYEQSENIILPCK